MSGEGDGGGGDSGSGSAAPGYPGGDISAILAYLNHQGFGADGDYTGNAGFGGDNTGPIGSDVPASSQHAPAALVDPLLSTPPRSVRGGSHSRNRQGHRSWAMDSYLDMGGRGLAAFVGQDVDAFSGRPFGVDDPDPFSGFPAADPFVDDWPARASSVTAPFAVLRRTNLLASPDLLAENGVTGCDPNRTSCLPELKSDANHSSLANEIQAEMDESFVAIQALAEGKATIIGNPQADMQKIASTAAKVALSDEHRLGFEVNRLRDHPLEVRHSSVLTGLGHVAWGGITMTASGLIIYGTGGLAFPLIGGMGFAAGAAEASSGLVLAFSGADSAETVRMSGQLDYVFALASSPASLVFGTTGLVLSEGDVTISHRFALVGGAAEAMATFRGDPSRVYSSLLPGVGTRAEKATSTLLLKDVAALGYTARGESVGVVASKLNREFTVSDLQAIEAFRQQMAATGRLDLAGKAGHAAAGAAERGVDFSKYRGAFQQELKLHGPYTPVHSLPLDKAWNQSLTYSIKYQLETRAIGGEQLVPLRSVKHIWVSPTEAVRYLR